jgi:hypothetical protein
MTDKRTPEQRAQMLKWLEEEDPKLAAALRHEWDAELADDPTRPPLEFMTFQELMTTEWPEPRWIVKNLLPTGLGILAGRQKVGKSIMALNLGLAVAAGGYFLDETVEKGRVLYFALEDRPQRLQERARAQILKYEALPLDIIYRKQFMRDTRDLRNGGAERLARHIKWGDYRLVIIDTFSRAIFDDQCDVRDMTDLLDGLQEIAFDNDCLILFIDHHSKRAGFSPDVAWDIFGSVAKGAVPDVLLGLYRERGKPGAVLESTGRDIEERRIAIKIDWDRFFWYAEGDADLIRLTNSEEKIIRALRDLGTAQVKAIGEASGMGRSNAHHYLSGLVDKGRVKRRETDTGKVFYHLPDDVPDLL